jgi:hypothetical protein
MKFICTDYKIKLKKTTNDHIKKKQVVIFQITLYDNYLSSVKCAV